MASLKIKFRPSTLEGKEGILYYQIIHQRVIRQVTTNFKLFIDEWNSKSEDIQVDYLKKLLAERKIELEISPDAKNQLAILGYNPIYGARPLKRTIRQEIENPLSKLLLGKEFSDGDKIIVEYVDDGFEFKKG